MLKGIEMSQIDWDEYFINMCSNVAEKSKDPSTKIGAIVVGPDREIRSTGFNGFARGVKDLPERYADRKIKYPMTAHAEFNCVCQAARVGTSLKDCTIYIQAMPCTNCSLAIIQSGIREIVVDGKNKPDAAFLERWKEESDLAETMLSEAGVVIRETNKSGRHEEYRR